MADRTMSPNAVSAASSEMNRRQLLRTCGAAAAAIGLTGSLRASNPYGEKKALKVKDLIWIQVNGGLSQLDTFDPKPGVAEGIRGPYKPIATRLSSVHFSEL